MSIKLYGLSVRKRDFGALVFFLIFWTFPHIYTGFSAKDTPFFPSLLTHLHSTSNLFIYATPVWPVPYIQILTSESREWITLPEADYFRMQTFGYRTRLFEILYFAVDDPQKSLGVQEELARWVAQRYVFLNPGKPQPTAVRFVSGLYTADPDRPPQGHWFTPSFEYFSSPDTYVLSTHRNL